MNLISKGKDSLVWKLGQNRARNFRIPAMVYSHFTVWRKNSNFPKMKQSWPCPSTSKQEKNHKGHRNNNLKNNLLYLSNISIALRVLCSKTIRQ
ncbi:hypothetical protein XENTR_v10017679 [Xenopus tropicalis]|nr:hypothetical protein XENTR_v10017679 [Xenopus tropicalis]